MREVVPILLVLLLATGCGGGSSGGKTRAKKSRRTKGKKKGKKKKSGKTKKKGPAWKEALAAENPNLVKKVESLLARARHETKDGGAAIRELEPLMDKLRPVGLALLEDENARLRFIGLYIVMENRLSGDSAHFFKALGDKNENLRGLAGAIVAEDPEATNLEKYVKAMASQYADVRANCVEAIGQLKDPTSFDVVMKATSDEASRVRFSALYALSMFKDSRVVPVFEKALRDSEENVRSAALDGLAQYGKPDALPVLLKVLKDPKAYQVAVRDICDALGSMGGPAVPHLIELLRRGDEESVKAAASGLSRSKDERAIKPLIEAMKQGHRAAHLHVCMMGRNHKKKAVPLLIECLKDKGETVRRRASMALEMITKKDFGEDYKKWSEWWEFK